MDTTHGDILVEVYMIYQLGVMNVVTAVRDDRAEPERRGGNTPVVVGHANRSQDGGIRSVDFAAMAVSKILSDRFL